jgi:deoxyribonuclease-4
MPSLSPIKIMPLSRKDHLVKTSTPQSSAPYVKSNGNVFHPLVGAHFSTAKGLHEAVYTAASYGCSALQLFTKNAMTWKERSLTEDEIARFEDARKKTGITHIAAHAAYLINLASPDRKKHAMSTRALKQELVRAGMLNIPYCIFHPGAHMDDGEDAGIQRIADTINLIFDQIPENQTRLLLETTSGQGSSIGHTFEQLARIIDKVAIQDRIGVCLDTCHIFAAGYDIRTEASYYQTIEKFASVLGLNMLHVIHFNDAKKDLDARVDRHEHIGKGFIGLSAFEYFINDPRFYHIPKILETPKGKGKEDWDQRNLDTLKNLFQGCCK